MIRRRRCRHAAAALACTAVVDRLGMPLRFMLRCALVLSCCGAATSLMMPRLFAACRPPVPLAAPLATAMVQAIVPGSSVADRDVEARIGWLKFELSKRGVGARELFKYCDGDNTNTIKVPLPPNVGARPLWPSG